MPVKTKEKKKKTVLKRSSKRTMSVPQRSDVAEKDKWNLTDIYKDDAAWEEDYKKAQEIIKKAPEFAGKLTGSAVTLFKCLETESELELIGSNLYQYAKLNQDLDNRVSKALDVPGHASQRGRWQPQPSSDSD